MASHEVATLMLVCANPSMDITMTRARSLVQPLIRPITLLLVYAGPPLSPGEQIQAWSTARKAAGELVTHDAYSVRDVRTPHP